MRFGRSDRWRLAGFYGFIVILHLIGWGLFLYYSSRYRSLVGLGLAAYLFGLRHAFDADHIAAVDDTVRCLLHRKQKALGVGFFFSLGHASVVFMLALALIFIGATTKHALPWLQQFGGIIGTGVSGTFLLLVGALNLLLLLDILKLWERARTATHSHTHLEKLLAKRGLVNRVLGARLRNMIGRSWHMYPVGVLFGLGFDTASEIGVLAMTAGAATGELPIGAALSLPILFAAGMSMIDTTDGVLMAQAYNWAFINPLRKILYNLTSTALSVAIALIIGSVELLQVAASILHLHGSVFEFINGVNFGAAGYVIVGAFLLSWILSTLLWRFRRPAAAVEFRGATEIRRSVWAPPQRDRLIR